MLLPKYKLYTFNSDLVDQLLKCQAQNPLGSVLVTFVFTERLKRDSGNKL